MVTILDGRHVKAKILEDLKTRVKNVASVPVLAIIQIGEREDSNAYITAKKRCANEIGAKILHYKLPDDVPEDEIVGQIRELNKNQAINGIILQIPIPEHLNRESIIEAIDPKKDVDGMTSSSIKLLWDNNKIGFVPATTRGIFELLESYSITISGKKVVVVGRSALVGKPTALMFLNRNATVKVCHSKTENLADETKHADILIVAIGKSRSITREYVKAGQVVIDVGINAVSEEKLQEEIGNKLVGDVDFDSVKDIVGAISPVPGGVGQMTVAALFENLLDAAERQVQ